MGLFDFFKKKKNTSPESSKAQKSFEDNIKTIVQKLEALGYFKYTDKNDIDEIKAEVYNSLKQDGLLSTVWREEKPYNSKDYRHYELDNETLFEPDGFTNYLKDFEHFFSVIGFNLVITNHIEEWDEEHECVNHSITINGKDYIIFKNFKGYGWGEAAQRFAEILNDQLAIQGKDERIYLSSGGNDGRAIVLTEAQFNLLDPILKHQTERPLRIDDWCKVMQVKTS